MIPIVSTYLKIDGGNEPLVHALWGSQFYLAGMVVFLTAESLDLKKLFLPFLVCFGIVVFLRSIYGDYFGLNYLVQYAFLLAFFLCFTLFQSELPILSVIGRNTMGVYLIHAPIVVNCVAQVVSKYIFDPIVSFTLILVGTFGASIGIVMAINALPYGCLLFGAPYIQKSPLQAAKP